MATKIGRKTIFCQNLEGESTLTLWAKNLVNITLSHTVFEINAFLHVPVEILTFGENSLLCHKRQKTTFGKIWQMAVYTLTAINLVETILSLTITEINLFWRFMQKFKKATENGWKTIFGKKWQMTPHVYPVENLVKITILHHFRDKCVFCFTQKVKIFGKKCQMTLPIPCRPRKLVEISLSHNVSEMNAFFTEIQKKKKKMMGILCLAKCAIPLP